MPVISSETSFDKAVKHLFRHLHDANALRRNPLVSGFFEDLSIDGFGSERDRAIIAKICYLICAGADHCRDLDLSAGKRERALRQHAIVMRHCLEKQPIRPVARSLGISLNYCYRERAAIYRRVARYILDWNNAPTLQYRTEIDDFRLCLDRAVRVATCSDTATSLREADSLIQVAESGDQKIEALSTVAFICLHLGSLARARRATRAARILWAEGRHAGLLAEGEVALAIIESAEAELAHHEGDVTRAVALLESATQRLAPIWRSAQPYVGEFYIACLNKLGGDLWNLGDVDRSYNALVEAESNMTRAQTVSSPLRTSVMIQIWRMRNRLLLDSKTWHPAWRRIQALQAAFEQAFGSGALVQAIEALIGLTEVHSFSSNEGEAMRTARLAIAMAKRQASKLVEAYTLLSISDRLFQTSYVEYALALLSEAERYRFEDAVFQWRLSWLAANRACRFGQFSEAWRLTQMRGRRADPAEMSIRKRVVAAASAYHLGRRREALSQVEMMVPLAERFGSAPVLLDAYRVAAKIIANRELSRKANEIVSLLRA